MYDHIPRLWKSWLLLIVGCGILLTGTLYSYWPIYLLGGLTISLAILETILLFARSRIDFYQAITALADKLKDLSPSQYSALGIAFPTLRIRFEGELLQYIEDTDIQKSELTQFLDGSGLQQTMPERNWISAGGRRDRYFAILRWLEENRWIYENSAAGNHSWLWRGSGVPGNLERMYLREVLEFQN